MSRDEWRPRLDPPADLDPQQLADDHERLLADLRPLAVELAVKGRQLREVADHEGYRNGAG